MAMTVYVKLTVIGADAGPTFDLFSNGDSYSSAFATEIPGGTLMAGETFTNVADGSTSIRVKSHDNQICNGYIDLDIEIPGTTTSTSTTTNGGTPTTTSTTTFRPLINVYEIKASALLGDICLPSSQMVVYSLNTETWQQGTTLYTLPSLIPSSKLTYGFAVLNSDGIVRTVSGGVLGAPNGQFCGIV